jgi:hypothetical protein
MRGPRSFQNLTVQQDMLCPSAICHYISHLFGKCFAAPRLATMALELTVFFRAKKGASKHFECQVSTVTNPGHLVRSYVLNKNVEDQSVANAQA